MSRQPRSDDKLLAALRHAGLQRYERSLRSRGIVNCTRLSALSSKDYASYGIISADDQRHLAKLVRTIRSTIGRKLALRVKQILTAESETDQRSVVDHDKWLPLAACRSNATALNDLAHGVTMGPSRSQTTVGETEVPLPDTRLELFSSSRRPGWYGNADHMTTGSCGELSSAIEHRSRFKLRKTVETRVVTSPGSDVMSIPGCFGTHIYAPEKYINARKNAGCSLNNGDGEGLSTPGHRYSSSKASANFVRSRYTNNMQPEEAMRGAANWNPAPTDIDDNVGRSSGMLHTNNSSASSAKRLQRRTNEAKSDHPTRIETIYHTDGYNYGVPKNSVGSASSTPRSTVNVPRLPLDAAVDRIRVCVRKRPRTALEVQKNDPDIIKVQGSRSIIVEELKTSIDMKKFMQQHILMFDEVFDEHCDNQHIYINTLRPVVTTLFHRGSAVCFAFGQTGAGKTHTLLGTKSHPGLYRLAAGDLFSMMRQCDEPLTAVVSYYEIYCNRLYDLLNKRKRLNVREDRNHKVCVSDLTEQEFASVDCLDQLVRHGNKCRRRGSTSVNPESSRSHALLQLLIRNSRNHIVARLTFIDLAGSERAADAMNSDRKTRFEGAEINQSLLALKECIRSIDQSSVHAPYRQSKLTHLLRDSFLGNSPTVMIANVAPTRSSCDNTLNTLRYADRVQELKKDVARKRMKRSLTVGGGSGSGSSPPMSPRSIDSFCSSRSVFPPTPMSPLSPLSPPCGMFANDLSLRRAETPIVSARRRSPATATNVACHVTSTKTLSSRRYYESCAPSRDFLCDLDQFPILDRRESNADRGRSAPEERSVDKSAFSRQNDIEKQREQNAKKLEREMQLRDYDPRWQQSVERERREGRPTGLPERHSDIYMAAESPPRELTSRELIGTGQSSSVVENRNSSAGMTSSAASCKNSAGCIVKFGSRSRDVRSKSTEVWPNDVGDCRSDLDRIQKDSALSTHVEASPFDDGLEYPTFRDCGSARDASPYRTDEIIAFTSSKTSATRHQRRLDEGDHVTSETWSRDQSCPVTGSKRLVSPCSSSPIIGGRVDGCSTSDQMACGAKLWRSPEMDDVRTSIDPDPLCLLRSPTLPSRVVSTAERLCSSMEWTTSSSRSSRHECGGAESTVASTGPSKAAKGEREKKISLNDQSECQPSVDDEYQMKVLWSRSRTNEMTSSNEPLFGPHLAPTGNTRAEHNTTSADYLRAKKSLPGNGTPKNKLLTCVSRGSGSTGGTATVDCTVRDDRRRVDNEETRHDRSSPSNCISTSGCCVGGNRSTEGELQSPPKPTGAADQTRSTPANIDQNYRRSPEMLTKSPQRSPRRGSSHRSTRRSSERSPRRSPRESSQMSPRDREAAPDADGVSLTEKGTSIFRPNLILTSLAWNQMESGGRGITGCRFPSKPLPVSPLALDRPTKDSHVIGSTPWTTSSVNHSKSCPRDANANDSSRKGVHEGTRKSPTKFDGSGKKVGSDRVVWNTDAYQRRGQLSTRSIDVAPTSMKRSVTPEMFVELSAKIADLMMRQEKLERASQLSVNIARRSTSDVVAASSAPATAILSTVTSRVDCGVQVGEGLVLKNMPTAGEAGQISTDSPKERSPKKRESAELIDNQSHSKLHPLKSISASLSTSEDCDPDTMNSVEKSLTTTEDRTLSTTTSPRVRINEKVQLFDYSADADIASCRRTNVLVDVAARSSVSASAFDVMRIDVGRVIHAVRGSTSLEDVSFSGVVKLEFSQWCRSANVDDTNSTASLSSKHGDDGGDSCSTGAGSSHENKYFSSQIAKDVPSALCSARRCSSRSPRNQREVNKRAARSNDGDHLPTGQSSSSPRQQPLKPCRRLPKEFEMELQLPEREVCRITPRKSPPSPRAAAAAARRDNNAHRAQRSSTAAAEAGGCRLACSIAQSRRSTGCESSSDSSASRQSSVGTLRTSSRMEIGKNTMMAPPGKKTGVVARRTGQNECRSCGHGSDERGDEDVVTDQSDLLISSHESQLLVMSRLGKKEKHLLEGVKSGHMEFDDYIDNTKVLLSQKAKTIEAFVQNIAEYH